MVLQMARTFTSGKSSNLLDLFCQWQHFNTSRIRVGFKSPATISQAQETVQYDGTPGTLAARGRHDPCVVPRAVPIVEAMASIVVMDQLLQQNARKTAASLMPPITTLPPTMVKPAPK